MLQLREQVGSRVSSLSTSTRKRAANLYYSLGRYASITTLAFAFSVPVFSLMLVMTYQNDMLHCHDSLVYTHLRGMTD